MHIIIGIAAVFGAVMVWYWRFRMAREATGEMLDVAEGVRAAARRFSYRRKHDIHPIDCLDDPRLAAAGIALAVASMDHPLSRAELDAMTGGAAATFAVTRAEADEITAFGRWIAGQGKTPEEAVRRLTAVVQRHAGPEAGPDLIRLVEQVATADGNTFGTREEEALARLRRAFPA